MISPTMYSMYRTISILFALFYPPCWFWTIRFNKTLDKAILNLFEQSTEFSYIREKTVTLGNFVFVLEDSGYFPAPRYSLKDKEYLGTPSRFTRYLLEKRLKTQHLRQIIMVELK